MNDYLKHIAQDRRLCVLRLLKESQGSANESVLHMGVEALGHSRQPRTQIREDMRFLEGAGLVVLEYFADVAIATITRRGVDVAEGRIEVEGVKKPAIGV